MKYDDDWYLLVLQVSWILKKENQATWHRQTTTPVVIFFKCPEKILEIENRYEKIMEVKNW